MKRLDLFRCSDVLILEKTKGQRILRDSHLFCGVCGGSVGQLKKSMAAPIYPHALLANLKHRSVTWSVVGLYHETCGHSLFCFEKTFDLIPLEAYERARNEHQQQEVAR